MDVGKGPHVEAPARTSAAGKKERGIKTNRSQGKKGRRGRDGEGNTKPCLGPGAIPQPCNESLPSLSSHVRALFWETEAGSAPAARRGRASPRRSSQGRVLLVLGADGDAAVTERGGRRGRQNPIHVSGDCARQKAASSPPPIPVTPSPTQAGNGW